MAPWVWINYFGQKNINGQIVLSQTDKYEDALKIIYQKYFAFCNHNEPSVAVATSPVHSISCGPVSFHCDVLILKYRWLRNNSGPVFVY